MFMTVWCYQTKDWFDVHRMTRLIFHMQRRTRTGSPHVTGTAVDSGPHFGHPLSRSGTDAERLLLGWAGGPSWRVTINLMTYCRRLSLCVYVCGDVRWIVVCALCMRRLTPTDTQQRRLSCRSHTSYPVLEQFTLDNSLCIYTQCCYCTIHDSMSASVSTTALILLVNVHVRNTITQMYTPCLGKWAITNSWR